MAGWESVEQGLPAVEYARRLCKEIGWPYSGNLTLLSECITSLAHANLLDVRGGFFLLMERIGLAKQQGVRVDRWFFQDGKYNDLEIPEPPTTKITPHFAPPDEMKQKPN